MWWSGHAVSREFVTKGMHVGVQWLWKRSRPVAAALVILIGAVHIRQTIIRRKRREKWASVGKDVVVLHCLPRGRATPHLSPYVLKLETYLRLACIPFVHDFEEPFGPKGKCPWITLNGEELADSQLVMEMLALHFNKDFTKRLTLEQQSVARALNIMMDEHLAWGLRMWRFQVDNCRLLLQSMPNAPFQRRMEIHFIKWKYQRDLWAQGLGRHSHQDVENITRKDIEALSGYLGTKPYLMGDEPCEVDCVAFGFLAQILWNYDGSPYVAMLNEEFTNLVSYVMRVKERLWPDWDQCLA